MNTVSDVLGNSGSPITATLSDGRVLTVKRFDQGTKTKIEQHIKNTIREQVMEDRLNFTDLEFPLAYGAWLAIAGSASCKFGGPIYKAFCETPSGGIYVAQVLCSIDGKNITEFDVITLTQHPVDGKTITLAIGQAMAESFPKVAAPAHAPGTSAPAA